MEVCRRVEPPRVAGIEDGRGGAVLKTPYTGAYSVLRHEDNVAERQVRFIIIYYSFFDLFFLLYVHILFTILVELTNLGIEDTPAQR